jgi:succinate dehydrogenase / fumarate reductase cytochrome b subunit
VTSSESSTFSFWWARLASFVAILPLGVWTVIHLANNLHAFAGAEDWSKHVTQSASPVGQGIVLTLVFLPLAMHTVWGLQRMRSARPNGYGTFGNLKYILQRLTAVGVLLFLGAHIYKAFIEPRFLEGQPENFADFAHTMNHHVPTLVVYLLGTLGVAYHLANGVSSFAWTWGLSAGRKSQARMDGLAVVLFLVLLTMAWGAVYALYQAGASL